MKREPTWIRIIRPPLVALGFVFSTVYSVLFGWWLDELMARKADKRLADEVKQNVPFLFTEKKAQIVPSDDDKVQRAFDLAVATVATEDFFIRLVRVRGEFDVEVASSRLLHRWEDLSGALENAELRAGASLNEVISTRPSRSYAGFMDVERLLRTRWATLKRYCE